MVIGGGQPSVALSKNVRHAKGPSAVCVWPERSGAKEGPGLVSPCASPILSPPLPVCWAHLGTLGFQAWEQQSVQLGPRCDCFPNLNDFPS